VCSPSLSSFIGESELVFTMLKEGGLGEDGGD
jgi:hypothetical protein